MSELITPEIAERRRSMYDHQHYLNYSQAARYTGLSIATLRRRVKEEKLEVIKHGGRILIEHGALDAMLHSDQDVNNPKGEENDK